MRCARKWAPSATSQLSANQRTKAARAKRPGGFCVFWGGIIDCCHAPGCVGDCRVDGPGAAAGRFGRDGAAKDKVQEQARSAKSWRVEGHIAGENGDTDFKLVWRSLDLARYELESAQSGRTRSVCDGAKLWTYRFESNSYTRLPRIGGKHATQRDNQYWASKCSFVVGRWQNLLAGLSSASLIGHDALELGGHSSRCETV